MLKFIKNKESSTTLLSSVKLILITYPSKNTSYTTNKNLETNSDFKILKLSRK